MLGVGREVPDVRLGVATGSVQQHQHRLARVTGPQIASPHSPGVEVALLKRDALEIAPDALELRHDSSLAEGNLVLVLTYLVC